MSDLVVVDAVDALPASTFELSERHRTRLSDLAKESRSERTFDAYESDLAVWREWCAENNADSEIVDPLAVAAFLGDMSQTRAIATVRRYFSSLSATQARRGAPVDKHHSAIRAVLDGARNEAVKRAATDNEDLQRRVDAVRPEHVRQMFAVEPAGRSQRLVWLRDRAVIMLGLSGGRRRSELAGLDWNTRGGGRGVAVHSARGILLDLPLTKTGAKQIAVQHVETIEAVMAWVSAAQIVDGTPLFRSVNNSAVVSAARLSDKSIAEAVKRRCKAIGLNPADFSGHSLRAGMVTAALGAGIDRRLVKKQSGHTSDAMLDVYDRENDVWRHAVDVKLWEGTKND